MNPLSLLAEESSVANRCAIPFWIQFMLIAYSSPLAAAPFPLWAPEAPLPRATEIPELKQTRFQVIQDRVPERDGYNWLHGVALGIHQNRLYTSFGHNRGAENTAGEEANGRFSVDLGRTWQPRFQIDLGEEPGLAISHGTFLSTGAELWAFQGAFFHKMQHVHTRAYVLDSNTRRWRPQGPIGTPGFWPMQAPQQLGNGHWIMAGLKVNEGISGADNPAAIALCDGKDLTRWRRVDIPRPDSIPMWGESTVIHQGNRVLCIARYRKPIALVSESLDFGETWSVITESNCPMAASKPYAGQLSTGHYYLIANIASDTGNQRAPLTIAISQPGTMQFSRLWNIREGEWKGPGESHPKAALAYPYAIEHQNHLYVGYSNSGGRGGNHNSAELAVLSLSELIADAALK